MPHSFGQDSPQLENENALLFALFSQLLPEKYKRNTQSERKCVHCSKQVQQQDEMLITQIKEVILEDFISYQQAFLTQNTTQNRCRNKRI